MESKYEGFKITGEEIVSLRRNYDGMAKFCATLMMDVRNLEQILNLSLKAQGEEFKYEKHNRETQQGTGKYCHPIKEILEEVTDRPLAAIDQFTK